MTSLLFRFPPDSWVFPVGEVRRVPGALDLPLILPAPPAAAIKPSSPVPSGQRSDRAPNAGRPARRSASAHLDSVAAMETKADMAIGADGGSNAALRVVGMHNRASLPSSAWPPAEAASASKAVVEAHGAQPTLLLSALPFEILVAICARVRAVQLGLSARSSCSLRPPA